LKHTAPTILVYGSIGDTCDFYKKWSSGRSDFYKCCYTYYKDNFDRSSDIESCSDFFEKRKGGKFENFFYIFDKLPEFDYYAVLDDDLDISPIEISSMVNYMRKNNYGVGSPSHSRRGRISWHHMKTQAHSYCRETNFVEMTAVIFSREELMKFFEAFRPYVDILLGYGTDFIIKNSCSQPFVVFDSVSVINPHDHQKITNQREILNLRTQKQAIAAWGLVKKLANGKFKE
jgi:hypothetical protein